jgi:dihydrofolate reductase
LAAAETPKIAQDAPCFDAYRFRRPTKGGTVKVLLYASLAANGLMMSADPSHRTPDAILGDFVRHARDIGSLILGRVTYEMMNRLGASTLFEGVELVVVSSQSIATPGAHLASSPDGAIGLLGDGGHTRALLGGGAALYSAFLAAGLVDELCLNVVPVLTSRGTPITAATEPRALRLLSSAALIEGVTQLRFAVDR